jgi:hypothetical protein
MELDFRQDLQSSGKKVPVIPLEPGATTLTILDSRVAVIGNPPREKLILVLEQDSSGLKTSHFMDMTPGHRWEFVRLVRTLLPMMQREDQEGVYDFEPGFLLDKKFNCVVNLVDSKDGTKQYNNLDEISRTDDALAAEEIPF